MREWQISIKSVVLCCFVASAAYCGLDFPARAEALVTTATGGTEPTISDQTFAKLLPGTSTKAQIQALLGAPWRTVQFDDCGAATWEYRGKDQQGTYRIHIEFDDHGVAYLVAKIPDNNPGGKATVARSVPMNDECKNP